MANSPSQKCCDDVKTLCAICLMKQEEPNFVTDHLLEIFRDCVSFEPLPREIFLICNTCEQVIIKWHSFKQLMFDNFEMVRLLYEPPLKEEASSLDQPLEEKVTDDVVFPFNFSECSEDEEIDLKQESNDLLSEHYKKKVKTKISSSGITKRHQCETCLETFATFGKLRTHLVVHKTEDGYKCVNCEKKFKSARSLWGHKRRHCEIKLFPCSECEKCFPFKHALDRHFQARHSDCSNFRCSFCPKSFKVKETLVAHVKKKHSDEPSGAVCNICGKHSESVASLNVHLRSHSGERPFICEFCSKGFVTKDHLTLHTRIHTGERPYNCENCGKSFISSSVLGKHKRSHTGEKPYSCHLCGKAFALSSAFKTHLKSH